MEGKYEKIPEENIEEERKILEQEPVDEPVEDEDEIYEDEIEDEESQPKRVVDFVDYREDVREWIKENNSELTYIEEAVEGLLKAFRHSTDFYDGLRRIDAKTDIGRVFLELVTRFMGQYERIDDSNYKAEVIDYINVNTKELHKIQERITYLLKAYEYAEDFLYGLERIEPRNDISRAFVELLMKFVERGLSDDE